MAELVIAVDPGREKCGVAVVDRTKGVLYKSVVETVRLPDVVSQLGEDYKTPTIILGNRTTSRESKKKLEIIHTQGQLVSIILVDEHRSTDVARKRYWQENPPRGLKRLIPVTMQVPPVPVDDYVAVILAERYFNSIPQSSI